VLISSATEAVLIDGGVTFPNGTDQATAIKATGKTLITIYVSQSDPDFYFNLKPITEAFPDARVIAASATLAAITANLDKEIAARGSQLKEFGPQSMADIVLPEAFDSKIVTVDGQAIEIVDATGLANRRYLFVPSLTEAAIC
jgi:glyoxylase-like metal-dependent hydrolase (beta-lactamase superfamily II)